MRRKAIFVAGCALALSQPVAGASSRSHEILRVDRVSASIDNSQLVIDAAGAVGSGGWDHPRLRIVKASLPAPILAVEFLADPPTPHRVVIEELLPVKATLAVRLPKTSVVAVSVASQTNTITTEIRR